MYPDPCPEHTRRHWLILLFAVILTLLFVSGVRGGHPPFVEGVPIQSGVGLHGSPPSYLCLIKRGIGHYGEILGTGSWVTDRLILTSYDSVRRGSKDRPITVHSVGGAEYTKCRVTSSSKRLNLALVYVSDRVVWRHWTVQVQDTPCQLGKVAAMGWDPGNWGMSSYFGRATGKKYRNRRGDRRGWFGHSAKTVPGMTGGPIIDQSMVLVGVTVSARGGWSRGVDLKHLHSFLNSYQGPTGTLRLPCGRLR